MQYNFFNLVLPRTGSYKFKISAFDAWILPNYPYGDNVLVEGDSAHLEGKDGILQVGKVDEKVLLQQLMCSWGEGGKHIFKHGI